MKPVHAERLEPFVRLALDGARREHPYHLSVVLRYGDALRWPRELCPAFYGCYDWHSAVHAHWLLARAVRQFPEARFAVDATALLDEHLTPDRLFAEHAFVESQPGFERPYGLAWLLILHGELHRWAFDEPRARAWADAVEPLAALCADRFRTWLPKLTHPVRSGVHSQTAFGLGFVLDWAQPDRDPELALLVKKCAEQLFFHDHDYPLHLEPSGEDFLSPSLGAADLMCRVLSPDALSGWLSRTLPTIPEGGGTGWLRPVEVSDPTDGRLAHLAGLNLSRAWMLHRLARTLPRDDGRGPSLQATAELHTEAGLRAFESSHYATTHWLGTFATYLLTT